MDAGGAVVLLEQAPRSAPKLSTETARPRFREELENDDFSIHINLGQEAKEFAAPRQPD